MTGITRAQLLQPEPPEPPERGISWSRLAGTRSCVGVQSLMSTLAGVKISGHISTVNFFLYETINCSNVTCDRPP